MFWITENHFLFVGLFDWGNAETQTFSVSRNRGGFALAESWTRKSGTVAPLLLSVVNALKGQGSNENTVKLVSYQIIL